VLLSIAGNFALFITVFFDRNPIRAAMVENFCLMGPFMETSRGWRMWVVWAGSPSSSIPFSRASFTI